MQNPLEVEHAAEYLRKLLSERGKPRAGVVLGTGLGQWADTLDDRVEVPYDDIPDFPRSTVESHLGRLVAGHAAGTPVIALQGRFHLYEGYSPAQVCMGVRVLRELGAEVVILTNAAGALNPLYETGGLMLITDHINLTARTPLVGPNADCWGPRFPDMSMVYDRGLRDLAMRKGLEMGLRLEQGIYAGVIGPCLETPAETRMLRILGADAVGMSTVMEAIAARHMGARLLGVSCLTNKNLPDCMAETSIEEVIRQAGRSSEALTALLTAVVAALP